MTGVVIAGYARSPFTPAQKGSLARTRTPESMMRLSRTRSARMTSVPCVRNTRKPASESAFFSCWGVNVLSPLESQGGGREPIPPKIIGERQWNRQGGRTR